MKYVRLIAAALAAVPLTACDFDRGNRAVGDVTTIVVLAVDSLWAEVGDSVLRELEPRIFTTRSERTFEVEQISPLDDRWTQLRQFTQVLAIGVPGDGWVAPVFEAAPTTVPAITLREDVWARGQTVTALAVPPEDAAAAVRALADSLGSLYDRRFRRYTVERMFASGQATALRDSLRAGAGFGLTLPNIYREVVRNDSVRVFRTETQVGGSMFRSIAIASRDDAAPMTPAQVLAWRDALAAQYYANPTQVSQRDTVLTDTVARGALEVQGVWRSSDTSFPEAGVFVTRAVPCPGQDRTYLLDAWLLAPGRSKYTYMIQFQNILDSFECAGAQQ